MTKNADAPNWGLYAQTPKKNMDARKSIKVKLPIRQHIKLHALKLFTEKNISETVEKALDAYFREMKEEDATMLGRMEANLTNSPELVVELSLDE
jgi:hypothetical protein